MKILQPIFLFIIVQFLNNCANPSNPMGGPRDTIPPTFLSSTPKNEKLNFQGDRITLAFDEPINADKLQSSLIITPTSDLDFSHLIKKNQLILKLESPLLDSTTYVFNFSNSVTDITERNPAVNVVLALSTTDYIDSISVSGYVNELLTQMPMDAQIVGLYPYSDTLDISQTKPLYFTKTDEEGYFKLSNIKVSDYKIFSFDDMNGNLIPETESEKYSFKSGILKLTSNLDSIELRSQFLDGRKLELEFTRPSGPYYELSYSKPLASYSIKPVDSTLPIPAYQLLDSRESIRFYNNINLSPDDSLGIISYTTDTLAQSMVDTVYINFNPSSRKPQEFLSNISYNIDVLNNIQIHVKFNKPTSLFSIDSIFFGLDTIPIVPIRIEDLSWQDNSKTNAVITTVIDWNLYAQTLNDIIEKTILDTLNSDSAYTYTPKDFNKTNLIFRPSSFISIENDSTEFKRISITKLNKEDLGSIAGTINTNVNSYKIQLMEGDNVYSEIWNENNYLFQNIPAGTYGIRILIDSNGDGEWSAANIIQDTEAESIYLFPSTTELKANWEITLDPISF